jgi:hypothetical protein
MPEQNIDRRPEIKIRILDKNNKHLSGATIEYFWGENSAEIEVGDLEPTIKVPTGVDQIRLVARYPGAYAITRTPLATDPECVMKFTDAEARNDTYPSWVFTALPTIGIVLITIAVGSAFINQVAATFVFGILLLGSLLALTFIFPNPTLMQYTIMRIILALAGAGIATMLTGFIEVISNYVKASGALGVFAVIYFLVPATLGARPPPAK